MNTVFVCCDLQSFRCLIGIGTYTLASSLFLKYIICIGAYTLESRLQSKWILSAFSQISLQCIHRSDCSTSASIFFACIWFYMKHQNDNVKSCVRPRQPQKEFLILKNIFNTQGPDESLNSQQLKLYIYIYIHTCVCVCKLVPSITLLVTEKVILILVDELRLP